MLPVSALETLLLRSRSQKASTGEVAQPGGHRMPWCMGRGSALPWGAERVLSGTFPSPTPPAEVLPTRRPDCAREDVGAAGGPALLAPSGTDFTRWGGSVSCAWKIPVCSLSPPFSCMVADCHHPSGRQAVQLSRDFPWVWGYRSVRKLCSARCVAWGA